MKNLLYAIFCSMIFISIGCDDECEDEVEVDLTTIDACEYILAPYNTTQKFSNDITTFELHFGPDTLEINEGYSGQRLAIFNDTDVECYFTCLSSAAGTAAISSSQNYFDLQWEAEEWYEGPIEAEDYIEDEELDARSWITDLMDASFLHPEGYPLMITFAFGFHVDEEVIGGYDSMWGTTIPYREDGGPLKNAAYIRVIGNLVEHLEQREVNGIIYEDVIRVEVRLSTLLDPEFQDGDDSPICDIVYNYWFANGIGLIETTDHDLKLVEE